MTAPARVVAAPKTRRAYDHRLWGSALRSGEEPHQARCDLSPRHGFSFIKATIADAAGNVVTSSSDPVTFAITGPGTIVAVDSGNRIQETFRGNTRNAFLGLAFALVQATGPGTITVTGKSGSLTSGSATVTATEGHFIPCSGTCD